MSNRSLARLAPLIALVALAAVSAGGAAPALGASFTVNATHDAVDASPGDGVCADAGGACTLRAAVMETNALAGADEISLPAGTYMLSIAGAGEDASATGDLDVADDLNIAGEGQEATVVSGGGLDRVIDIRAPAAVALAGITFRDGLITGLPVDIHDFGGGIFNSGELSLLAVTIAGNSAVGGGIFNEGTLSIEEVMIVGNRGGDAGGILNHGSIDMSNSELSENRADGAHGGALVNVGTTTITDSLVSGNSANISGGGIYNLGIVTLLSVMIEDNIAKAFGGGVQNGNVGTLMATNTQIIRNRAVGGVLTLGGGLNNDGTATLVDVTVSDNAVDYWGGGLHNWGVLSVTNALVVNNTSAKNGGGIANSEELIVADSEVMRNAADEEGGGIYNEGTLTMFGSTIGVNSAPSPGAAFANQGPDAVLHSGVAFLTNSTISGNTGIGLSTGGQLSMLNVTIAHNSDAGLDDEPSGETSLRNTIIGDNSGPDCALSPSMSTLGNNLDTDGTCGLGATGDISNGYAGLGGLADNGGATRTSAIEPGHCLPYSDVCFAPSDALDAGANVACPPTDQRGVSRPIDGNRDGISVCDIGAYESPPSEPVPPPPGPMEISPTPSTPALSPTSAPSPALPTTLPATGGDAGSPKAVPLVVAVAAAAIVSGVAWHARRARR
jgi:hypothetical protein